MEPKQFTLNVGGTRYKISDSLLDRFPDSMLRNITSHRWNESDDDSAQPGQSREIFIERNGGRFKFILDFMMDGKVVLPLSVPRQQLVNDMEYYGLNFDESQIVPDMADSDGMFDKYSEFWNQQRRFRDYFEPKRKELDDRYRALVAESYSYEFASKFFERLSDNHCSRLDTKNIEVDLAPPHSQYKWSMEDLRPHLNEYELNPTKFYDGWNHRRYLSLNLQPKKIGYQTTHKKEEKPRDALLEEKSTKQEKESKRIKLNVGGTTYEVSQSLLDRFPDSMLSRSVLQELDRNKEIFFERDGERFEFVLDYMRDGKVVLPVTILRPQLVEDMNYFGIDFDASHITLGVADPNDLFHKLSNHYHEEGRFKNVLESKKKDIEARYYKLAVESVSCAIASSYFEAQFSARSFSFEAKTIHINLKEKQRFHFTIEELQPYLTNLYGLHGFDLQTERTRQTKDQYPRSFIDVKCPLFLDLKVRMLV